MNMLEKLRRLMEGRYGFDSLGRFLFGVSLVFWLIAGLLRFTPFRRAHFVFWLLNLLLYGFAVYRMLSRDIGRRQLENERYLVRRQRVLPFLERLKRNRSGDPGYFFKNCPNCGAKLRLRRIRGRHRSRCPKCGKAFSVLVVFGQK